MKSNNEENIKYLEENIGKTILPLSIFEQTMPGSEPIEILFFYKKDTSVLKLKESILKTIEHYNLFSSRLIMISDNKFALQYCTDGFVPTILPPIDAAFDDINIEDIKNMMVHVKTLPGEPLFAVTGIPIKDGILAGISCSHLVADGISLLLFLYAWMCITEGKSFPLPSTQRLFKGNPISSNQIDKVFSPQLSELSDGIQNRVKRTTDVKTYSTREYFTEEFLNEMKNKAKSENEKYIISSNQIITSILLKKYHSYMLPNTDKIVLRTPVNFRDIHPDIDSLYIGNAQYYCVTQFTKDEIDKMSICEIAYRMKESIMNMRNENFIKELSHVSNYGIEIKTDMFKNDPPGNVNADILSSNLTHLNDLESLGVGSDIGSILYISLAYYKASFIILKEKSGRIFAEITSRYPFM
jgi:hypothetical protein